jgi:ferritin-like protein
MTYKPHALMQYFSYTHLPPHLQQASEGFARLAHWVDTELPNNPEKTTALRKLLEAKDCAVRAMIYKEPE